MKKILIALLIICFGSNSFAQFYYPATRTVDSSNTFFGVTYKDSNRRIEGIDKPEAQNWIRFQALYTEFVSAVKSFYDKLCHCFADYLLWLQQFRPVLLTNNNNR